MAEVKIAADSGGGSVGLVGPASTTGNAAIQLKLPVADGSAGQVLKTDGSGNLSWVSLNGISHIDQWRLTTDFTDEQEPIASNLERAIDANGADGYGTLGDPMTQSSGVFTFPVTGIWKVEFVASWTNANPSANVETRIDFTIDNGSNWTRVARSFDSIGDDGSHNVYANTYCSATLDITDVSQRKVQFDAKHEATTVTCVSHADENITCMTFTRLGDT